jgi:RNA polymerase sigma-70 factor (ECF subfamily)
MSNDSRRFTGLIEPHLEALFRTAYRLARNRADAEDLVQETCVRAFVRLVELREEQAVKSWLLRVLHNLFVDGARRARRSPIDGSADGTDLTISTASSDPTPEECACTVQGEERLQRAWLALDRGHRALLALRAEGYTVGEIAEIVGVAPDALNTRLYRARQSFARHLGEQSAVAHRARMEFAK